MEEESGGKELLKMTALPNSCKRAAMKYWIEMTSNIDVASMNRIQLQVIVPWKKNPFSSFPPLPDEIENS